MGHYARTMLAATVLAGTALVGSGCEASQINMALEHCGSQPDVQQCLGSMATLGQLQNSGMSEATATRVAEINNTMAPSNAALLRLRNCESTNRYNITNRSGKYMGAYQFDQTTWNGVVDRLGLDDFIGVKPNKTAPPVQDAAARGLVAERGRSPWPVCGKRM